MKKGPYGPEYIVTQEELERARQENPAPVYPEAIGDENEQEDRKQCQLLPLLSGLYMDNDLHGLFFLIPLGQRSEEDKRLLRDAA